MTNENDDRPESDDLRAEYDLDSLGPGVRGRYFERATARADPGLPTFLAMAP